MNRAANEMVRARLPIVHFAAFFLSKRKRETAIATAAFACVIVDALDDPEHDAEMKAAETNPLHVLPNETNCPPNPRLTLLLRRIDEIYAGERVADEANDEDAAIVNAFIDVGRERIDKSLVIDLAEARGANRRDRIGNAVAMLAAAVLGVTRSDLRDTICAIGRSIVQSGPLPGDATTIIPSLAGDGSKLAASVLLAAYARHRDPNGLSWLSRISLLPKAFQHAHA